MKRLVEIFKIDLDPKRVYGLDILRAIAILLVVFGHGNNLLSAKTKEQLSFFQPDGVTVFFVLSGFLIGGILIKTIENNGISFKVLSDFWRRRWLRTLPLYYIVLTILICLSYFFTTGFDIKDTRQFFFFLQNLDKAHSFFYSVSWSLSIEEWFYLLVPVLLFSLIMLSRSTTANAVFLSAAIVILWSVCFRYYRYEHILVNNPETFDTWFRRPVITRLDSIMFGVIGAYLFYFKKTFWVQHKNIFFIAGLVLHVAIRIVAWLFFQRSAFYHCNLSFLFEAIANLMLLPFFSQLMAGKTIVYKSITYLSLISYSMYLLHAQVVIDWILIKIPQQYLPSLLVRYLFYWSVTILLSILSYKYIEVPFMKIRGHSRTVKLTVTN